MRLPAQLLHRKFQTHKGDFGHILILAGCAQFSGAAILCSNSAIRAGGGMVTLGIPRGLINAFIKIKSPEVILKPLTCTPQLTLSIKAYPYIKRMSGKVDILIVGPGLSQNKSTQNLIRKIISGVDKPMVIDADGLNALAGHLDLLQITRSSDHQVTRVLTPHPGEMSRLLNVSINKIQRNRKDIAQSFARDYNCIIVLKGHRTVVADAEGRAYTNKTGNPGMATAGSGDVLTGMIAALLAQGLDGFKAAKYAVYLHGLAGDLAAKEKTQPGMIASDIIEKIPEAIKISS